jgi:hypothetical protein
MLCVEDVDATVAWYTSFGHVVEARNPEDGRPWPEAQSQA